MLRQTATILLFPENAYRNIILFLRQCQIRELFFTYSRPFYTAINTVWVHKHTLRRYPIDLSHAAGGVLQTYAIACVNFLPAKVIKSTMAKLKGFSSFRSTCLHTEGTPCFILACSALENALFRSNNLQAEQSFQHHHGIASECN
jgi:hypothetical protein